MNRPELVAAIAHRSGYSTAIVDSVITTLASTLVEAAANGDKVHLPGVLTLETSQRPARNGRHPRTGEPIVISARRVVKITPGATLKRAAAGE